MGPYSIMLLYYLNMTTLYVHFQINE